MRHPHGLRLRNYGLWPHKALRGPETGLACKSMGNESEWYGGMHASSWRLQASSVGNVTLLRHKVEASAEHLRESE
jgi:hypothetical protein